MAGTLNTANKAAGAIGNATSDAKDLVVDTVSNAAQDAVTNAINEHESN